MASPKLKRKKDQPAHPAWHPNFRNFELLPDTKVVRTAFFVNTFAVALLAGIVLFGAHREYAIWNLREQIGEWEERIEQNRRQSSANIAHNRKFLEEERKINEVHAYLEGSFPGSGFLIALGHDLPEEMRILMIENQETGARLRGFLEGSSEEASGVASAYLDVLREKEVFRDLFGEVSLTNLSRDPTSGRLSFEIVLRPKEGQK